MSQFRNLVFEGGGVKGIAYAGALRELERQGILPEIKRVAGTSAGAITAVLVALGASADQVEEIVGHTKFREFMDDSFGVIRDMNRLVEDYGWFKGETFSAWMQKQIMVLAGQPQLTFGELAERAGKAGSRCKELYMIASDLTLQMPIVYSAKTTPDAEIWEAVRMSMSIPLFFASVKKPGNKVFVDGGVTWNYPLDLFDDVKYLENPAAGIVPTYTKYDDNHRFNKETLGFRVDTHDEILAEKDNWNLPPVDINDFFDYAKALVGFMGDMANKMHLHGNDWHRTVAIDAAGVKTTQFDLSDELVELLVNNGESATKKYFDWFNDPAAAEVPINRVVLPPQPAPVGNPV